MKARKSQNSVEPGHYREAKTSVLWDWGRESGTDEGDEVVGLVVAEEVLVQEHPGPYKHHGSPVRHISFVFDEIENNRAMER